MKNRIRKLAVLTLSVIMVITFMTGCSSKPTADDAKAYVQATLDLMCTGDYDHSVKLADVEEGNESAVRDQMLNEVMTEMTSTMGLDEDTANAFMDAMLKALSVAKYEVVDAVPTEGEEGGFDVTVSIEPLKMFDGVTDTFQSQMPDITGHTMDELAAMTQAELTNVIYKALFKYVSDSLDNPTYAEAVEVTVHYGLLDEEKNVYGCDESEGQKIGEKLISLEGI